MANISKLLQINEQKSSFDLFYLIIMPITSILAIIFNAICSIVFMSNDFKTNNIYKYLAANSMMDVFLLISLFGIPYVTCSDLLQDPYSYWPKVYHLVMHFYVARTMHMMSSFLSITIVLNRYLCMIGIRSKMCNFKLLMAIFTVISLVLFTPNLLAMGVNETNSTITSESKSQIIYTVGMSELAESYKTLEIIFFLIQWLPSTISLVIMIVFTSILLNELRKQLARTKRLINQRQKETSSIKSRQKTLMKNVKYDEAAVSMLSSSRRDTKTSVEENFVASASSRELQITMLVILISTIFIIDQLLIIIVYMLPFFTTSTQIMKTSFLIIYYSALIGYCSYIFVYYFFNRTFSFKIKCFACKIKSMLSL